MEKFKILAEFIKDVSSETKDIQTYLFVKDYISKYQLTIDINSKPTKNSIIVNIYNRNTGKNASYKTAWKYNYKNHTYSLVKNVIGHKMIVNLTDNITEYNTGNIKNYTGAIILIIIGILFQNF